VYVMASPFWYRRARIGGIGVVAAKKKVSILSGWSH